MEVICATVADLEREAARFVETLAPQEAGATLVTLSGELGAGKTAFTKAVAKAFGVEERVTSPTFVLEKVYQLAKDKKFARLVHIDAYRLESGAALAPLGFDDLMRDSQNLILLEWPEQVVEGLPEQAVHIAIRIRDGAARLITYT